MWLELVIHPSAMLAFQERRRRHRLERRAAPGGRFFAARDWFGILFVGASVTASVLAFYVHSLDGSLPVEHARANAIAALSLSSATLVAGLSRLGTPASRWISGATVLLTAFLVQTPGVSEILHLQALHLDDWLRACGAAVAAGLLAVWFSGGEGGATAEHRAPSSNSPGKRARREVAEARSR